MVGEALIDIVISATGPAQAVHEQEHVGGSPANVAVGLAMLGHQAHFLTHVGDDEHGQRIREHLAAAGVALEPGVLAERTSTATARLDADGAASYDFDLSWQIPGPDLTGFGHVHTGSIAATLEPGASQVLATIEEARPGATISYDPNLRPTIMGEAHQVRSRVEEIIGRADVVKASDEDIDWLYAGAPHTQVADLWGRLGPGLIVVTCGADGAYLLLPATGETQHLPSPVATVVDTVGAGDSFMSGLLSGLLDAGLLGQPTSRQRLQTAGLSDIRPAAERALACAHFTIERAGAAAPTRSDLTDLDQSATS